MVLPKVAPQVPSVVALPVGFVGGATTDEGLPRTGSPDVVVEGGRVAVVITGMEALVTVDPVQPFWHPFAGRQCPSVLPQYP